jgi:hypothetical protein
MEASKAPKRRRVSRVAGPPFETRLYLARDDDGTPSNVLWLPAIRLAVCFEHGHECDAAWAVTDHVKGS